MSSENFGGAWIIFPIIMIPTMMIFMYFMFVRGGRGPWQGSGGDLHGPGHHRESRSTHDSGEDRPAGVAERPLDILNRRYATGEITKEEFDQMKQDLS